MHSKIDMAHTSSHFATRKSGIKVDDHWLLASTRAPATHQGEQFKHSSVLNTCQSFACLLVWWHCRDNTQKNCRKKLKNLTGRETVSDQWVSIMPWIMHKYFSWILMILYEESGRHKYSSFFLSLHSTLCAATRTRSRLPK